MNNGCTINIDFENDIVKIKKPKQDSTGQSDKIESECESKDEGYNPVLEITKMLPTIPVLPIMETIDRHHDFISVLKSLVEGTLDVKNVALHLLLDIGKFLRQNTLTNMRYHQTSLDFG
jgi:hypothetical protein